MIFVDYVKIIKQRTIMTEQRDTVETCCKYTCCADGCCSDGCETGQCSSACCRDGCCDDSDNCCSVT